jgi:alcohol dehydrogenase (cytochrome c)
LPGGASGPDPRCDMLFRVRRASIVAILLTALALLLCGAGITEQKLRNAQSDTATWLSYGKNYAGWRFADLAGINRSNVARLTPKWIFQTGLAGKFEATPLVFDRLVFVTGPSNHAYALDALTGRPIWHYQKQLPNGVSICCGQVNRGFAALGDTLFKVNLESKLVALDSKTGSTIWESEIDDIKKGYSATVAPLIAKNLVVIGIAGAEFGVRGFIDAYAADTGKRAWRFWTVAGEGEPGGKTWGGDSWKRGGGSTWITGTYDPELNLIYWGTGNPGPDMNGDDRPGDNLYTCSLVALDADTGKLKWHYQFTPHDVHDWDAIADPVLVDLKIKGKPVKAVVQANRNGFYYALDRATGKLLASRSYTKVTWADGIGADGRPNLIAGQDPTEEGNQSCPGIGGGHNWQATAYSPRSGLYYFTSTDGCQIYYKTKQDFIEGQWYQGSTTAGLPTQPTTGSIIAVDPATGETRWRTETVTPVSGGLLATAGGLVFTGDAEGYLIALDAASGKPLWKFQTGGRIIAPPISYSMDGKQYIAVAAGASLITFTLP